VFQVQLIVYLIKFATVFTAKRLRKASAAKMKCAMSFSVILRITGFLEFVHRPVFYKLEHTTFRKLYLFPSSGERGETPTLLGPT
jgi:hypothetical protein